MDEYTQFIKNEFQKAINTYDNDYESIHALLVLNSSSIVDDEVEVFLLNQIQNSNLVLLEKLVEMASDDDDFGEGPRNASYFIKEYEPKLLIEYEDILIELFKDDDESRHTFLAIALAKMQSSKGKDIVYSRFDKKVYSNWIIEDAIRIYEGKN